MEPIEKTPQNPSDHPAAPSEPTNRSNPEPANPKKTPSRPERILPDPKKFKKAKKLKEPKDPNAPSFLSRIQHFLHHIHLFFRRLKNRFLRTLANLLIPALKPYHHLPNNRLNEQPQKAHQSQTNQVQSGQTQNALTQNSDNDQPNHNQESTTTNDSPENFAPNSSNPDFSNPNFSNSAPDPYNFSENPTEISPEFSSPSQSFAQNIYPDHPEIFEVEPYTPESLTEFINLIKRTPKSVLSKRERNIIATVMNFPHTKVESIMLPPEKITYVRDNEVIGPLTLDRLYQSGFQHFPVIDSRHKIIGLIHTGALSSLEIKESSRADEILDRKVYYLRNDYTLSQALAAFLRTNSYFFLVVDRFERIVGMLTYQTILDYLLGETPTDQFDRDHDRYAVAKRKM